MNEANVEKEKNKALKQKAHTIREKHNSILDNFNKLKTIASKGILFKDFVEPKVNALWSVAQHGNFSQEELNSLHVCIK